MSIVRGRVQTLGYGGKGIIKNPDQPVIFIPFTAPEDEIECQITREKKNYSEAVLRKVLEAGPDRVLPLCPYFGTCGGCQLQHLNYDAQVYHKQNVVQDFLKRVYPNAEVSISRAHPIWAYRRHVTLTIKQGKLGYYTLDNQTLIEIEECPIFCKKEDPIFKILRGLVSSFSDGKVKILKTMNHKYILGFNFKQVPSQFWDLASEIFSDQVIGITANSVKKGCFETKVRVEGIEFPVEPSTFLQVHPEQSEQIYKAIKTYFEQVRPSLLLDLYCGIGISSVLVAPFAGRIVGVEMNRRAIELAKVHKISHIDFQAKAVEDALPGLLSQKPDAAIVNPPREGLDRAVAVNLAMSSLMKIVYISCQPATLMRDLQIFKEQGFHLKKAQAFDMFPQTGHVETLVIIER